MFRTQRKAVFHPIDPEGSFVSARRISILRHSTKAIRYQVGKQARSRGEQLPKLNFQ